MRQIFARGLAIAASLALLSPVCAQSTFQPTTSRFNSILSTLEWPTARSAAFTRGLQDHAPAVQEGDASSQQTSPSDKVLPEAGPTSTNGSNCGATGSSYFDSNATCNTGGGSNWVVGVYALGFDRDYEDDVGLSAVPSNLSLYLNSTSAEMGSMGGLGVSLSRRDCGGCGSEIIYWGLYPDQEMASLTGAYTNLTGLSQVEFGGNPVSQFYNSAVSHSVYRDNEFHNLEFNCLRCIGSSDCGNRSWEWLAGFRYFAFDEHLRYAAFAPASSLFYDLDTQNDLYGVQVGVRTERCCGNGFGVQFGTKLGVYGNHIEASQSIHDGNQAFAEFSTGPYAGTDYAVDSSKDDLSMVGELNLGLTYQIKCDWRAVGGYRAIGFSGVALAPDQIPLNFSDRQDIARVKSDGSLILHGAYFGLEHSF